MTIARLFNGKPALWALPRSVKPAIRACTHSVLRSSRYTSCEIIAGQFDCLNVCEKFSPPPLSAATR